MPLETLILVPANAQYYAAYGAVVYGLHEAAGVGVYRGLDPLKAFIAGGRKAQLGHSAGPPLINQQRELCRGQRQRLARLHARRPQEHTVLEPFGEQAEPSSVPEYDLDEIGSVAAPEYEQVTGERMLPPVSLPSAP